MSQVDFYILPENSRQERFACLMAHKIWRKGKPLFINAESKEAAESFDNLLWTYHDISFVPHELINSDPATVSPVIVGWQGETPENSMEVILNLAPDLPTSADRFARIVEIVAGDNTLRQQARKRYREYKNRGYELYDHNIESDHDRP